MLRHRRRSRSPGPETRSDGSEGRTTVLIDYSDDFAIVVLTRCNGTKFGFWNLGVLSLRRIGKWI